MKDVIFIAFYTQGTPYETVINEYLLPSIRKHSLHSRICAVPDRGSWIGNIAYKPRLIADTFREYPDKIVVYLDADARIEEVPVLFGQIPEEYDIAFHMIDHDSWYGKRTGETEVYNGTIWLRNNPRVQDFVQRWIDACKNERIGEHKWFEQLIKNDKILNKYPLPLEYAYIVSLPDGRPPLVKIDNPVITHHQVSRKLRYKK